MTSPTRNGGDLLTGPAPTAGHRASSPPPSRPPVRKRVLGVVLAVLAVVGLLAVLAGVTGRTTSWQPPVPSTGPGGSEQPTALLETDFEERDGDLFADQRWLWDGGRTTPPPSETSATDETSDRSAPSTGATAPGGQDQWFAESGRMVVEDSAGRTDSAVFRLWSVRTDLAFSQVEMDVRFDGWTGGEKSWHGINLWMNRSLCSPVPECSAVDDPGANSGYVLDFLNRDGRVTIQKKVPGDTRDRWPERAVSMVEGGTYYELADTRWQPEVGRDYRFSGRVVRTSGSSALLQVLVDGRVLLEVEDDGAIGGPVLQGGRVGLRGDHAAFVVDDLRVLR